MYFFKNTGKQLLIFQNYFGVLSFKRYFLISSVICMGKITLYHGQNVVRKLQIEWPRYILRYRDMHRMSTTRLLHDIYLDNLHYSLLSTYYTLCYREIHANCLPEDFYIRDIFYATETCPQQDSCKIFTWDIFCQTGIYTRSQLESFCI